MLSRTIFRSSAALLKTASKNMKPVAVQSFSSLLDQKEHAEETKYIRRQEERRKEEIRSKLDAILAQEEHSKERQHLVGLLGEEKCFVTLLKK
jgi:hypothetical protein